MSDLPQGWTTARLGDVVSSMKNGLYKPADAYADDGVVCLRMYNIDQGKVVLRDLKRMRLSDTEVQEYGLLPGDLLVNRVNSRELVGKTARIPESLGVAVFESKNIRVRLIDEAVSSQFVSLQLLNGGAKYFANNAQQVVGMASVSQTQIAGFPILLPPKREQARVVEKLDELFSDLDAGIAALERARANLKRYRAAVLKAAVEARLTEKWRAANPKAEPAEKLLERILGERRKKWEEAQLKKYSDKGQLPPKGWKDKYPVPAKLKAEALPKLPTNWCWATLDQLADIGTGATPLRSEPKYWNGGSIPWVTSAVVNSPYVNEASELVTPAALEETNLFLYPANTLILAMYGEGKTRGKVSELLLEATTNQALAALVFFETASACRSYVKTFLAKSYEDMRRIASGGVQPNMNLGLIKEMRIPLPPLDEQAQITLAIDRLLSVQERLVQEGEKSALRASRLRQSILKRAFEGKLVPQDPKDEPASELLARIRARRADRAAGGGRDRKIRKKIRQNTRQKAARG